MIYISNAYGTAAWIFSSYLIVAAVMTPIAGKMSDLHGKKKVSLVVLTCIKKLKYNDLTLNAERFAKEI